MYLCLGGKEAKVNEVKGVRKFGGDSFVYLDTSYILKNLGD
jgi:hypothetical protein